MSESNSTVQYRDIPDAPGERRSGQTRRDSRRDGTFKPRGNSVPAYIDGWLGGHARALARETAFRKEWELRMLPPPRETTDGETLVQMFFALPCGASPMATWVDGVGATWAYLHDYIDKPTERLTQRNAQIRLTADWDGWRDGIVVQFEQGKISRE